MMPLSLGSFILFLAWVSLYVSSPALVILLQKLLMAAVCIFTWCLSFYFSCWKLQ
nr:hypothetical protein Iba_chr09aCG3140 [Ipomoea batatas]GMD36835.1 hypothetical protein Iba_chr09eCG3690 [Ipomoea batatas]